MMPRTTWIIFALASVCLVDFNFATIFVQPQEWADYKTKFNKTYGNSDILESYAKYYYVCNKIMVERHNRKFDRGMTTFRLAINEFSDRPFLYFKQKFPAATAAGQSFGSLPPAVLPSAASYDPIKDFGFELNIENQGIVCNSGWAYSAAKAIEMLQAQQSENMTHLSLSAQNLIDCAGRGLGCTNQVPQAAFDYLAKFGMDLHLTSDYPNENTNKEENMCRPRGDLVVNLASYTYLGDTDNESLMRYLSNGFAIVVEMAPCYFEFIHYSSGIYQQPFPKNKRCSHSVLLLGYGTDETTGMDYWLVQNSFGRFWGEDGLMRVQRTAQNTIFKNAIFPTELA